MRQSEKSKVTRARRMMGVFLTLYERSAKLSELAKKYKINERSILRDLKLLRDAGAVIKKKDRKFHVVKVKS